MYAGKIAEYADTVAVFQKPWHPYTQGLISAFPNIRGERKRMVSIPGITPDLLKPPLGCRFHPRCQYAKAVCKKEEPRFLELENSHFVSCHKAEAESKGKEW
jgi:peptide/nickel transport system ATP-binding protein